MNVCVVGIIILIINVVANPALQQNTLMKQISNIVENINSMAPDFVSKVHAEDKDWNTYDSDPYPGTRNFNEWMAAWNKDVKDLLKKQRLEWESVFGENI
jgi:hypothetical protein